jgi:hypothetical protein
MKVMCYVLWGLLAVCLSFLGTGETWADGSIQKWTFQTKSVASSSSALGPDGATHVGSDDRYVYAIKPAWTHKWDFEIGDDPFSCSAIGPDGIIYVVSNDGKLYAIKNNAARIPKSEMAVSKEYPEQGEDKLIKLPTHQQSVGQVLKEIKEIRFEVTPEGEEKVTFVLNGPHLPETFGIEGDRPRMVCDFFSAFLGSGISDRIKVKGKLVQQIRTGVHGGPKPKVRVVMDLAPQVDYKVQPIFFRDRRLYMLIFTPH